MTLGFREAPGNPAGGVDRLWLMAPDAPPAPPARIGPRAARLRLLHVNDLHTHFLRFGAEGAAQSRFGRFAAHVVATRAAAGADEAALFLSAGDDHVGTVLDELMGWSPEGFTLDAAYRLLSAAGLDAAAVGNHDLDRGAAVLACGAAEAAFPLLSANLGCTGAAPAALVEAKGLRVGIVGLITASDTRPQPGIALSDPVAAMRPLAAALAPHADLVLLLSHCGRHVDVELAPALAESLGGTPGLIVGGHTHHVLNREGLAPENVVAGIPILQAGCKGAFMGEALWTPEGGLASARLIACDDAPEPWPGEAETLAPVLDALSGLLAEPLATVEGAAGATEAVRAERYSGECALADLFADLIVARAGVGAYPPLDLAAVNSTYFAAGLGPGPATMGDLCAAAPYAETVWVADVTAADLLAILDSNARRILRPEEGPPPGDGFVHRGFLHFSKQLRYRIALGADAGAARAVDVTLNGAPLDPADSRTYALGLTTYLALGGFKEGWKGTDPAGRPCPDLSARIRCDTGAVHRAEVARALAEAGTIRPALDGRLTVGA
jgi:2',3'-cyclic-nucleotide 2'-phosphodiesterase (5'-nucleotidase family)